MTERDPGASFAINVLENDRGEILLLKRRPGARLAPGLWGFPAGHIEEGESAEQAAWRELREEIGPGAETRVVNRLGPVPACLSGGTHAVYLFHHRWLGGRVSLNEEHTDYAWVDRHAFPRYPVMDGIDADLYYLGIWPAEALDPASLPPHQAGNEE